MQCDLVIINHGSCREALTAIRSARHHLGPALADICVVENGTGEADQFRTHRDAGRRINLIEYRENRGFASGVNAGVGWSLERSRHRRPVLVMNPDAYLVDGRWASFVTWVVGNVGIAAPRVLTPGGDVQASVYGEPAEHGPWMEALGIQRWVKSLGISRTMPDHRTDVVAVQGSCFMISPRAWKEVGPFDERFFLYHEEVDWCLRARARGFVNIYDPTVSIVHAGGVDVPPGREVLYYTGAVTLIRKHCGEAAAVRLAARLKVASRLGALLARDPARRAGLRELGACLSRPDSPQLEMRAEDGMPWSLRARETPEKNP